MQMEFRMIFDTPAFIGDAERKGAMRSPPIKALLRQFWRIAEASRSGSYDIRLLREKEGWLFGHAYGEKDEPASKSRVRIRLDSWEAKLIWELGKTPKVFHPEVSFKGGG